MKVTNHVIELKEEVFYDSKDGLECLQSIVPLGVYRAMMVAIRDDMKVY